MPARRVTRSPRRRVASFAVALCAALLPIAGMGASYADDPTPAPTASPSPNDDAPAQVLVTKLAPRAPLDPDGFFQVRGILVNRGSQTLHELTVRLRRGDKLSTRGELATADVEPPVTPTRVGRTPVRAAVQDLEPGQSTTFDIRIRVSSLRLGAIGVYPLRVEARARFGDGGGVDSVGGITTYVPWFPDGPPHGKIRVAWLWPLVDQPRRGPREVMLDDELATSFAKGGRLDRMLRSAADGAKGGCDPEPDPPVTLPRPPRTGPCRAEAVPMTYAVDPDLLFTADALTRPYQLLDGTKTERVDDTGPARGWLDGLRDAVGPGEVLSLPYADPDVVALTAPENGLADEVSLLREQGKKETANVLGRQPMTSVVWPPAGRLTRRTVETLTSGGATALVVDPVALPEPENEPGRTPDTDVGQLPTNTGQPKVLTIDPALSALLTPTYADYPGDRVVEQRWLAETAMISAEAPSVSRTILVAPARRADLHTAVAADAIRDTGRLPWLCPVSLASIASARDTCADEVVTEETDIPSVELAPARAEDVVLSTEHLRQVRALRAISTQFTDEVLAEPTSKEAVGTTGRLLRARARAESSAWHDRPGDGEQMLRQLKDDLADLRGKVHLQVGSGTVTLTSSTGVISVNVVNELSQPVRVGVVLDARNRARLSTRGTPITTVRPESAAQINLKVTAQTSGTFPVTAQLVDHDGQPFGGQVRLVVRSTQYGRVALAVTGIAAGVLLVAAGVRIARRAMRRTSA
ncbi:MAG: hypothetical protein JJD92_15695 [Frankiaceae bacterium]|nr:hypothetical protein [Frankiaceae bacterium]